MLVFHDILGLFDKFTPKFVKQYANLRKPIIEAITTYKSEVENGLFPADEQSFDLDAAELKRFRDMQSQ